MKVIDYEETMKCLDEVEDCEDKTYAKSLLEWAINKRTFEAVPLSVIEKIKAEIERKRDRIKEVEPQNVTASMSGFVLACSEALAIIDKAVKEISDESTRSKDAI